MSECLKFKASLLGVIFPPHPQKNKMEIAVPNLLLPFNFLRFSKNYFVKIYIMM